MRWPSLWTNQRSRSTDRARRPESFWLRYRMGLTCQRIGRLQDAVTNYSVCLGLEPDFAWVPFNTALVYIQLGESDKAIEYLERSIFLDSKLTAAYVALGALHFEAGELKKQPKLTTKPSRPAPVHQA